MDQELVTTSFTMLIVVGQPWRNLPKHVRTLLSSRVSVKAACYASFLQAMPSCLVLAFRFSIRLCHNCDAKPVLAAKIDVLGDVRLLINNLRMPGTCFVAESRPQNLAEFLSLLHITKRDT